MHFTTEYYFHPPKILQINEMKSRPSHTPVITFIGIQVYTSHCSTPLNEFCGFCRTLFAIYRKNYKFKWSVVVVGPEGTGIKLAFPVKWTTTMKNEKTVFHIRRTRTKHGLAGNSLRIYGQIVLWDFANAPNSTPPKGSTASCANWTLSQVGTVCSVVDHPHLGIINLLWIPAHNPIARGWGTRI